MFCIFDHILFCMKYIEQLIDKKPKLALYIPIPLVFFLMMLSNALMSEGVDTKVMIQQMIDTLGRTTTFVTLIIPLSIACLILIGWVRGIQKQTITSLTTSRSRIDWGRFWFSFMLWALFIIGSFVVTYALYPENYQIIFQWDKFIPFAIIALILVPLQTSFEEYLFRGHMMQGLGLATKTRWLPFILTSVLFGLAHYSNPEVGEIGLVMLVYYIGTGFFLGLITLMDDGLELALGFHASNNLIGVLLITTDWSSFQTNSIFKDVSIPGSNLEMFLTLFLFYPLLIFIFARKYRWTHWSQKLFGKLKHEKYA